MKKILLAFAIILLQTASISAQFGKGLVISSSVGVQQIYLPAGQANFFGLGILGSGVSATFYQPIDIQYFIHKNFGFATSFRWVDSQYDFAGMDLLYKGVYGAGTRINQIGMGSSKTSAFNKSFSVGPVLRFRHKWWYGQVSGQFRSAKPFRIYAPTYYVVKDASLENIEQIFLPNNHNQNRIRSLDGSVRTGVLLRNKLGVFAELGIFKYQQTMSIFLEERNFVIGQSFNATLRYDDRFWYWRWGLGCSWNLGKAKPYFEKIRKKK